LVVISVNLLFGISEFLLNYTLFEEVNHSQNVHLMLDKVDVDFDLGRICRIKVHPEFIELFRMGLKGGHWQETEPGLFEVRPI